MCKRQDPLRKRLLYLLSLDTEWYKKDNELTRKIQEAGRDLVYSSEAKEVLAKLSVDEFLYLVSRGYTNEQIARMSNLTKEQFSKWLKVNGFSNKKREYILEVNKRRVKDAQKKRNKQRSPVAP